MSASPAFVPARPFAGAAPLDPTAICPGAGLAFPVADRMLALLAVPLAPLLALAVGVPVWPAVVLGVIATGVALRAAARAEADAAAAVEAARWSRDLAAECAEAVAAHHLATQQTQAQTATRRASTAPVRG